MSSHLRDIQAVLFDVDGVLVDATDWHFEALNLALAPYGVAIGLDQHRREFLGMPTRAKVRQLIDSGKLGAAFEAQVLEEKQRLTLRMIVERCKPDPTKAGLLRALRRKGLRLGAVSNAIRESVVEMLARSALLSFMDAVVSGDDVERPKPDPAPYIKAAGLLEVPPGLCLAVEDGQLGVQAAASCGMQVARVPAPSDLTLEWLQAFLP